MMKFIIYMIFLIPLIYYFSMWEIQFFMFFIMFLFMILMMNSCVDFFSSFSYFISCDLMSYGLILLTMWICSLMIMASVMINKENFNINYFMLVNMILLIVLFLTFSSMNLLMFYFFFEFSLIPILFMILGWGFQSERIQAGLYLLFYTLFASLPLLITIIYIYYFEKSLMFYMMIFMNMKNYYNLFIYIGMIFAFLVKMPMFLVHLWLPKAHVEAPVAGSMILAGVMLKLGGYGLLRMFILLVKFGNKFNYLLMSLSMFGGLLISLICLFQFDLKSLIAYSSVAHMSLVLGGIFTLTIMGMKGAYLMMIAHGLCSSGLFCLVNIMYERLGSRSLLINKGLLNFIPSLSLWWFLLCSSNMAAPPSLNLMSEIILINSMVMWNYFLMVLILFLSFFSALYTLYLYSYSQHGQINMNVMMFSSVSLRENLLLMLHWIPLNLMILCVDLFI